MSSAAFVIGDWLVYGEDHFRGQQRLPSFESESIVSVSPSAVGLSLLFGFDHYAAFC